MYFQLVIVNDQMPEEKYISSKEIVERIKSILISNDIKIDALYSILKEEGQNRSPNQSTIFQDYQQILNDFSLTTEKKMCEKVLFVQPLNLDFSC